MGMTQVRLIVKNPRDPKKQMAGEFLVDSGAHYTVLPLEMVRGLKLKPSYEQDFSLADGKIISRSIGGAVIRFEDRELPVPVVLGEKNDTGLLGVTTLESFGLMLDPFQRKIYKSKLMLGCENL